jgi:hypothetical protein
MSSMINGLGRRGELILIGATPDALDAAYVLVDAFLSQNLTDLLEGQASLLANLIEREALQPHGHGARPAGRVLVFLVCHHCS